VRRRDFLKTTGGAIALGGLVGCAAPTDAQSREFSVWSWVHGGRDYDDAEWRRRFARLKNAGFGAVLVGGGDIGRVSDAAHAEGLEYHSWFWTLNRPGDAWAQDNHPEWFTVSRNGDSSLNMPPYVGYYKWVCPTREPVRRYLRGLVDDLALDSRVDGVHLDYVADFEALTGRDPFTMPDPTADEEWRQFRWNSVTRAVRELADTVHARNKPITAAVFPTPDIARTLVRQSWDEWPLDRFFPMLYNGFYLEDIPWIGAGVAEGVAALRGSGRVLNAGLYLPDLSPEDLGRAVATARDAGASGVSFFESEGLTDAHLDALAAVLS